MFYVHVALLPNFFYVHVALFLYYASFAKNYGMFVYMLHILQL
jgi:hypothetical protein